MRGPCGHTLKPPYEPLSFGICFPSSSGTEVMALNLYRRREFWHMTKLCRNGICGQNNVVIFQNQPIDKIVLLTEWNININLTV